VVTWDREKEEERLQRAAAGAGSYTDIAELWIVLGKCSPITLLLLLFLTSVTGLEKGRIYCKNLGFHKSRSHVTKLI